VTFAPALSSSIGMALTRRQYEIVILVTRGCTNPEIGAMLGISVNAVKKHVSRVLVVVDASNRTELAAIAGGWPPEHPPIDEPA
jgi:DNA-binding NarL/FixJ family response regulator